MCVCERCSARVASRIDVVFVLSPRIYRAPETHLLQDRQTREVNTAAAAVWIARHVAGIRYKLAMGLTEYLSRRASSKIVMASIRDIAICIICERLARHLISIDQGNVRLNTVWVVWRIARGGRIRCRDSSIDEAIHYAVECSIVRHLK